MDTDELSNESYDGIIIESEKFNHDLTLQYDLSYNEVKNVDPEFELTKEEYE